MVCLLTPTSSWCIELEIEKPKTIYMQLYEEACLNKKVIHNTSVVIFIQASLTKKYDRLI
jgi:hypothetical protein